MKLTTYLVLKVIFVLLLMAFGLMFVATFWEHGLAAWLADLRLQVILFGVAGLLVGGLCSIREEGRDYWKSITDFMWSAWSFVAVAVFFYAVLWKLPGDSRTEWSFDFLQLLQATPPALKTAWFVWALFAAAAKIGIALADVRRAIIKASGGAA